MTEFEFKHTLAKIILTLQSSHHGCNEEAVNIALDALNVSIEHNPIREMINIVTPEQVDSFIKSLELQNSTHEK